MTEETVYIVARKKSLGQPTTASEALERRFFFVLESARTYANAINQRRGPRVVPYRTRMTVGEPVGGRNAENGG